MALALAVKNTQKTNFNLKDNVIKVKRVLIKMTYYIQP